MTNNDRLKNQAIHTVTTESELANMLRYREKFVQKLGQETYDRLVKQLENHIRNSKRPKSASPTSEI